MLLRTLVVLGVLAVSVSAVPPRDRRQFDFFAPPDAFGPDADFSDSEGDESEESPFATPNYSSFGTALRHLETMMTSMRRQLQDAMHRIPSVPSFRFPQHPIVPSFKPSDIGFDDKKPTNTSSITKVINGHKVTVNETTYESNDGGKSVFRIKIVDVQPHKGVGGTQQIEEVIEQEASEPAKAETHPEEPAEDEETKETSAETSDEVTAKSNVDADENEIPEDGMLAESSEVWEQQADVPSAGVHSKWPYLPIAEFKPKWQRKAGFKSQYPRGFDVEMVPGFASKPIDLSNDLRVNQLLSDKVNAGGLVMPDPDSEFVEVQDGKLVPSIQTA